MDRHELEKLNLKHDDRSKINKIQSFEILDRYIEDLI